jgi:hypothetical protein
MVSVHGFAEAAEHAVGVRADSDAVKMLKYKNVKFQISCKINNIMSIFKSIIDIACCITYSLKFCVFIL